MHRRRSVPAGISESVYFIYAMVYYRLLVFSSLSIILCIQLLLDGFTFLNPVHEEIWLNSLLLYMESRDDMLIAIC